MRPVVIDVEQAEQVVAVEERRRAQRVEALLDDRRPDVVAARVVAVADREQRPVGLDGGGRQRSGGERRGGCSRYVVDSPRLTSAAMLPVVALQEDGRGVALEQDHRVVDQAGQDPVEVEPAADVAGDPAERLRPVEQVVDLVGAPGAADERAERRRRTPAPRRGRAAPSDPAVSPTISRTPHGPSGPGIATASSGRPSGTTGRTAESCTLASSTPSSGPAVARARDGQRRAPRRGSRSRAGGRPGAARAASGATATDARAQPIAAGAPRSTTR